MLLSRILLFLLIVFSGLDLFAQPQTKGGYMRYDYLGAGISPNSSQYKVVHYWYQDTLTSLSNFVFLDYLFYYDGTGARIQNLITTNDLIVSERIERIESNFITACRQNTLANDYRVEAREFILEVTNNTGNYAISVPGTSDLDDPIINLSRTAIITPIYSGATIPGFLNGIDYHINSTPFIKFTDTVTVCRGEDFSYQVEATDPDNDSLSYQFGDAVRHYYPFRSADFVQPPYSSDQPMGNTVTINPATGLISGRAPEQSGDYFLAMYVNEWRKGVLFNTTIKQFVIKVARCVPSPLSLEPVYANCQSFDFKVSSNDSGLISTYLWDFGLEGSDDTSTMRNPVYTYADTGTYVLKLYAVKTNRCVDSAQSVVKIYPGFEADFDVEGYCYKSPFLFTEQSELRYGTITNRKWIFGDPVTLADTSLEANPQYQYASPRQYEVRLEVTSSNGCTARDSMIIVADSVAKLTIPFNDTLICVRDNVVLLAEGRGSYAWSPDYNLLNGDGPAAIVSPKLTTLYTIDVEEGGCTNSGTVLVRVVDSVSLQLPEEAGICLTDSLKLSPETDALAFLWTESGSDNTLDNYSVKSPVAFPSAAQTTYYLTANLGSCESRAAITVYTSPYPEVDAGNDTVICFNTTAFLNASSNGHIFSWRPGSDLTDSESLQTIARPAVSTSYILSVTDSFYCRKPVNDTVFVEVIPAFPFDAGPDQRVVPGQPVQLSASSYPGAVRYSWQPSALLDDANIQRPVARIDNSVSGDLVLEAKAITEDGCEVSDELILKIYRTTPDIFVPNGFSPNGDGKNDLLKPLLVGVTSLDFFRIYNRYGQLVYNSNSALQGWDGKVNGVVQTSGSFIYTAQGKDYTGKPIIKKGMVTLVK